MNREILQKISELNDLLMSEGKILQSFTIISLDKETNYPEMESCGFSSN